MSDMVKLTGLWSNQAKDGTVYFAGTIGMARLLIFENKHKRGEKDPDYVLYLAPKERQREPGDESA